MRIGLDFDNTIACYDGVFHAAALERGLIDETLPRDKTSVRDYLNSTGRKDEFTELQGYVYGARMDLAAPYEGVRDFIIAACEAGHEVFIVSHKTRTPMLGPAYDLHAAARGFLQARALIGPSGPIPVESTFFELTKTEKVARAWRLELDLFVDDLPEILAMDGWPPRMRKILFDPERTIARDLWEGRGIERASSWADVLRDCLQS
jgi:hypothetical protein